LLCHLESVKAGGMRIVQKHQSAGDATSDRKEDKDSKEFESCRSALISSLKLAALSACWRALITLSHPKDTKMTFTCSLPHFPKIRDSSGAERESSEQVEELRIRRSKWSEVAWGEPATCNLTSSDRQQGEAQSLYSADVKCQTPGEQDPPPVPETPEGQTPEEQAFNRE
ncbi:death-associated protein 1, partial [Tachysurus ichikawai]